MAYSYTFPNIGIMKTKIFFVATLLMMSVAANAQEEEEVVAESATQQAELPLQSNPRLVIGSTELSFTDGTTETKFSADEKVVIKLKSKQTATQIAMPEPSTVIGGEGIYTLDGKRLNAPKRGINIVRMSDGKTKKVIVE